MNIAIVQFLKTCRDACRGERLFRQFRPPRQLLLQPLAHRSADVRIKSAPITGGVAERLIAPVLKTGRPKGLVSSNLTPSASKFRLAIGDFRLVADKNVCPSA